MTRTSKGINILAGFMVRVWLCNFINFFYNKVHFMKPTCLVIISKGYVIFTHVSHYLLFVIFSLILLYSWKFFVNVKRILRNVVWYLRSIYYKTGKKKLSGKKLSPNKSRSLWFRLNRTHKDCILKIHLPRKSGSWKQLFTIYNWLR